MRNAAITAAAVYSRRNPSDIMIKYTRTGRTISSEETMFLDLKWRKFIRETKKEHIAETVTARVETPPSIYVFIASSGTAAISGIRYSNELLIERSSGVRFYR
jgi:hypothetical protein